MARMNLETALASVFAEEYQAHPQGEPWENVMRAVAYRVAMVLYPEDGVHRASWCNMADMSGLFRGEYQDVEA